jgi:putative DNA primase/helicase
MPRIARDGLAVNTPLADTNAHTDAILGSSEGAAEREAQATAHALLLRLAASTDPWNVLPDVAYEIGRLIGHGLLDRSEIADALRLASARAILGHGEDAVQEVIAAGFREGAAAAADDLAIEAEAARGRTDIVARLASDITPRAVEWLWPARIPRGKLALLGGHPSEGKTLISLYMAAVVSTGGRWADGTQAERGQVLILSAEDDAADTIVPRLMAAGADLAQCHIIEAVRDGGVGTRTFSLIRDLERLDRLLDVIGGAALMTVDVIDSYLGDTDSHRNAAVRGVLAPFAELAARRRMAVLGLTHFRKQGTDRAILRFTGSIAFIGQARAGWIATPEIGDDGEPTGRRLFLCGKGNLAPDIGGLAYRIEGATVAENIPTARIVWEEGAVMMGADAALAPRDAEREEQRNATEEAAEWLTAYLGELWWPSADVVKAARAAGITERTLERARARLRCQRWHAAVGAPWLMALPGVAAPDRDKAANTANTAKAATVEGLAESRANRH